MMSKAKDMVTYKGHYRTVRVHNYQGKNVLSLLSVSFVYNLKDGNMSNEKETQVVFLREMVPLTRTEARSKFREGEPFYIMHRTFPKAKLTDLKLSGKGKGMHTFHFYIKNLLKKYNCKSFKYYE